MSTKDIILTITPTVSGPISLVASSIIISKIYHSRTKLRSPYNRILFGLSVSDVVYSFCCLLSTYMSPKGTPDVWGAVGNEATCKIQGFLVLLSITTTPFYNCALCIYYLCIIRYAMPDDKFSSRIEPALHVIPFCWGWFSAIYCLSQGLINNTGPAGCWIAPYPSNCIDNPDVDCIRGENIHVTRWIFNLAFILLTFLVIIVTMSMMFWSVWRQEARMNQYRFGSNFGSASGPQGANNNVRNPSTSTRRTSSTSSTTRVERARSQAVLYCGAWVLSFIPSIIQRTVEANIGAGEVPFVFVFAALFLNPLQGLFNLLVFIQPQVSSVRRENPDISSIKAFLIGIRTLNLDQRMLMRGSRRSRRSSRHLASISVQVPRSSGIINSIKAFIHSRHKNADKDEDCPAEDIPPISQNSSSASNQIPLDPFEEDDPDLKFGLG